MSGLFGGGGNHYTPAPPAPKPPAPMPDTDSPLAIEARRKAQMSTLSRAGRSSTILTAREDRGGAGFDTYTSGKLGAGA